MISKGTNDYPENAMYQGGALNQRSYMEEGGLAHDDSLLTGLKDEVSGGMLMAQLNSSKASPRTSG